MDEVTKQFYRDVETFAPRNHRSEIDWKGFPVGDYDTPAISSNYYQSKGAGVLPSVHIIAAFTHLFSKDELEQFAFHKLKTSKRVTMRAIAKYEKIFGKRYTGKRPPKRKKKADKELSLEERELEEKQKRTPFEKMTRRRLLMEYVWAVEHDGV